MIKVTVLVDNNSAKFLEKEHGMSMYIDFGCGQYLFDTGSSDLFLRNAKVLNIPVKDVKTVILSHGHWDHGNGLEHLQNKDLIAHSFIHKKRYRLNNSYLGLSLSKEDLEKRYNVIYKDKSCEIAPNMYFLTSVKRSKEETKFLLENGDFDQIEDDSSIAIKTQKGIVLLSGCAHAGVENHIKEVLKITGEKQIYAVVGGLHLKTESEAHEIGGFLKKHVSGIVYTGHCTTRLAMMTLAGYVPVEGIYSGFEVKF